MTLSICTAQLNFAVGDMPGNAQKIIAAAREALARGARLLLAPAPALCGYAAESLLLRPAFLAACDDAVKTVARETQGLNRLPIVLAHPQALGSAIGLATGDKSKMATGLLHAARPRACRHGAHARPIRLSDYKRRQAPSGERVARRRFGKDWRHPLTNRFRACGPRPMFTFPQESSP